MKLFPAELVAVALIVVAISRCAGSTDKPSGYPGEVLAKRTSIDHQGEMIVVITVGFSREPDSYEQDTREYSAFGPEGRLRVGDCVLVRPFGNDVRLLPCP